MENKLCPSCGVKGAAKFRKVSGGDLFEGTSKLIKEEYEINCGNCGIRLGELERETKKNFH